MTEEELKKEAEEWVRQKFPMLDLKRSDMSKIHEYEAYLAGAEPREKRIAELSKHIVELQNDKGEFIDRCRELEAQIEKMKRCEICKHYQWGSCNYHSNWVKDCKENGMKLFELKEIKEK